MVAPESWSEENERMNREATAKYEALHGPLANPTTKPIDHDSGSPLPPAGSVWGDPHQPHTWRLVMVVKYDNHFVDYCGFGPAGRVTVTQIEWDSWRERTNAVNITGEFDRRHDAGWHEGYGAAIDCMRDALDTHCDPYYEAPAGEKEGV